MASQAAVHRTMIALRGARGQAPYLCLEVNLWVPVRVIEDDDISGGQVDAQPTGTGGQHEEKLVTAWPVVLINELLQEGRTKKTLRPRQRVIRWDEKCYIQISLVPRPHPN